MPNSYVDYSSATSDQVANGFVFSFPYLSDAQGNPLIDVYVEGAKLASNLFTIVVAGSTTKAVINAGSVVVGNVVKVARNSSTAEELVDFVDGSVLTEEALDLSYKHGFYLSQEAAEGSGGDLLSKKGGTDFDAENNKITNLSAPTTGLDAANKEYVDQTIDNAELVGGSPATVSLGGYNVTSTNNTLKELRAWTADIETALDADINVIATGTTADRSLADRFADVVNVKDYGATGDGVTDDTSAIQAAEAAGDSVYFPEGNYNVTVAPTLNKSWGEGTVSISGTQTYLHPQPGPVSEIFASVFSPNNTASADASTELQRAIDFAQDNDLPLTLEEGGLYRVFTGLTFKHGQSATDTQKYSVKLNGNGATLYPDGSAITVISVVPRCLLADQGTGRGVSGISIKDLTFSGYASTSSKALVIGEPGYACDNFLFSRLENILIHQFESNAALFFRETRHFSCKKVVVRNSTCRIEANTTGSFCGDMVFNVCEFVSKQAVGLNPLDLSSGGTGQIRGIHFNHCYIYGSQTELICNGTAPPGVAGPQLGDIWFDGCQFDQGTGRALYIAANNDGQIFKINIISCYFVAYGAETIRAQGSAEIGEILINNCTFSIIDGGNPIFCLQVDNVQISNNNFKDVTNANQYISIDACQQVSISDNVAWDSPTVVYGVSIGNASDRYFITDNMFDSTTSAINDYSTGTPLKAVLNNLQT